MIARSPREKETSLQHGVIPIDVLELMLALEEAVDRILATIKPLAGEIIPLKDAAGRIALEQVTAGVDLPSFDNSAMDGYAVHAADLARASREQPVRLRLSGRVAAGETFPAVVRRDTCVRVFTGSPLPHGADAVVMQEDTRLDSTGSDAVWFLDGVHVRENIRSRGEDVKCGSALVESGDCVGAGRIGLLAAAGVTSIVAGRKPVVGLLATGSELVEAGSLPAPGRIYESNRPMLAALAERAGAIPRIFPLVPDSLESTRTAIHRALSECDVAVTSGGVSVGEFDFVKRAFVELGGHLDFWTVAIKPGKPFVFGRLREQFLFGLPGNPVSAFVTFLLLVRPALRRMQGAAETGLPTSVGVLTEAVNNPGDRRHFLRVVTDSEGGVRCAGTQASHILSSLAKANGLIDVPARTTFAEGTSVRVRRIE